MPRVRLLTLFLLVALTALPAGGCGDDGGGRERSSKPATGDSDATVVIADMSFDPDTVTVPAGGTVAWRWEDAPVEHDVALDGGPASPVQEDGSWQHTFDEPGTHEYLCTLHPAMTATVVVR